MARRFATPIPPATGEVDDLQPLVMPIDTEFRVGTMGLGWDANENSVVVELLAVTEESLDESIVLDDRDDGPDALRVFLTTEAARGFAARRGDRVRGPPAVPAVFGATRSRRSPVRAHQRLQARTAGPGAV